jgi:hypothetical protein
MEQLLALLGLGATGGFLTNDAIDRLGDIGDQSLVGTQVKGRDGQMVDVPGALDLAQLGLDQTEFKPFSVTSSTGSKFGFQPTYDAEGALSGYGSTTTLSPEEQAIQSMLMGQSATTLGANPYGQQAGRTAAEQAYGLGGGFMTSAGMPTAGREADVYERIRATQRPEEERQRMALEERLFNQGRSGVSTNMYGGTPEQLAMAKAQGEAQNQASLAAIQQGQAEQMQQAKLGQAFTGMGSELSAQDLAMLGGQQKLGLGSLAGSYIPQGQMNDLQAQNQMYAQLGQRGQISGAGLFGEASMGGLEARLIAEQAQANLLGNLGSGLLSGIFSPVAQAGGGATSLIASALNPNSDIRLKENIKPAGNVGGVNFYTWDWNEEGKRIAGNQATFGVLAQEARETHPEAIHEGPDGYLRVDYSKIIKGVK